MKLIPVARGTGRPFSLRIPSERAHHSRRHQSFRYWSLDIAPHKEMISALRRSSPKNLQDIKQEWVTYLKAIDERQVAAALAVKTANGIWKAIARSSSTILPPNARLTEDSGLRLSWNREGRYVEILIRPDGTYEWFYTDTSDAYDGDEDLSVSAPIDQLLAHLRDMF